MVKEIVKDLDVLSKHCSTVIYNKNTKQVVLSQIQDLLDTAKFYEDSAKCVGLAANQIGYSSRVIVVKIGGNFKVFINPVITKHSSNKFLSEEGCLSLEGMRIVERFAWVTLVYLDIKGKAHTETFKNFSSVIVQHEVDHLNGKLI